MDTKKLYARDFIQPGQACHFTRSVLSRAPIRQIHTHDFYEVFWLQHGRAKHIINGQSNKLSEGDLVFVRPQDSHALQGQGDETHVVNIIFTADLVATIAGRFALPDRFFWAACPQPDIVRRDMRQLADTSRRALVLERGSRSRLSAEAFLIPLLSELVDGSPILPDDLPNWLAKVCREAHQPEVFREGAAGLVRVSGRSHAHVSRSFKHYLDETPSDYVNRIRMAQAARALTGSSDGLGEIADVCGIRNLSHFHRLFRETYGTTPKLYRKKFQLNAVQPI